MKDFPSAKRQPASRRPECPRHVSMRILVLALACVVLDFHPSAGTPEAPGTDRGPRLELGTLTRIDGTKLVTQTQDAYLCLNVGKSRGWFGPAYRALADLTPAREDYPNLQFILFVDEEDDPDIASTVQKRGFPNIVVHSSRTRALGKFSEAPPWVALVTNSGTSYASTTSRINLREWLSEQLVEQGVVDPEVERLRNDLRFAKETRDHELMLACSGRLLEAGGAHVAPEVATVVRFLAEKNYRTGVFEFAVDLVDRFGCIDDAVKAIARSALWVSDDDLASRVGTVSGLMSNGCPEVGLTVYELTYRKDRDKATAFVEEFRSSYSGRRDVMKQWFDYFAYSSHSFAGLPNRTEIAATFGELAVEGPADLRTLIQVSKVYETLEDWSNAQEILGKALEGMSPDDPDYETISKKNRYLELKAQSR